jgi:excisionase family DNA binding protein
VTSRLEAAVEELVAALRAELRPAPAQDIPDTLLTIEQARVALGGIARSTIYLEIGEGRLRTVEIGRRRLIPSSAIAAYIAGGTSVRP